VARRARQPGTGHRAQSEHQRQREKLMPAIFKAVGKPTFIAVIATIAGVALILYAWRLPPFRSAIAVTENAYVRGSVTIIAPKVDGYVAEVLTQDFAPVSDGQILVQLDDRNYVQKLAQAEANLQVQEANLANVVQARRAREASIEGARASLATARAQDTNARAQLSRTQADQRRARALVADGSLSEREHDQTEGALRQAEAGQTQAGAGTDQARAMVRVAEQELRSVIVNRRAVEAAVATARAGVELARIDLQNTRIRAPRSGHAGEIGVKVGQYVTPGTQLLAMVPDQVWIVANFKEAQIARMAPGQPVEMQVDALPDAVLHGKVERIAPATGSEFSVIRPDNATGNFTKIVQRIPVRIAVDAGDPLVARLRPGMSVIARVDTGRASP
jgi:multidrug resistance efflux pump